MNYHEKAGAMHRAIMANFYVPEDRLFQEHTPPRRGEQRFSYLWPYLAVFSAVNAGLGLPGSGATYLPVLSDLLEGVEKYWLAPGYQSYVAAGGHSQRYYDDNAWLGIEFLGAYVTLREQSLLDKAQRSFEFVLSGWTDELGGGLYWREGDFASKNTCSNGPAAVLALMLHRVTGAQRYLDWAQRLYEWTTGRLRAPGGLYWDSISPGGSIDRHTYTYNAGIMIQAGLLLHEMTGEARYRHEALATAAASLASFAPQNGVLPAFFPPTPWFNAVLFRAYLAVQAASGESSYARAMLVNLEHGWQYARDDRGLVHPDWSGRSGVRQAQAALLDQAPVVEIYALAAQAGLSAAAQLPQIRRGGTVGDSALPVGLQVTPGPPVLSLLGTRGTAGRFAARGIYTSEGYGSFVLTGELYAYYEAQGGPGGPLGFPIADAERALRSPGGTWGWRQQFEGSRPYPPRVQARLGDTPCGAAVFWAPGRLPHATSYEIGEYYESAGGPGGPLGYPISDRLPGPVSPQGTTGFEQQFEGGAIYWSPLHGTHCVLHAMARVYQAAGGPGSALGYPVADQASALGDAAGEEVQRQRFEGGWLYQPAGELPRLALEG